MLPTPAHTESSLKNVTSDRSRKPLVLVVDPDESTRSVLEMALTRDGFDVWSASGRAEGMLLLSGHLPDVIVLESDLGGDQGFTFVAELRGDQRLQKIPVILLARPGDANVEAMADVVGVDDFLQKPAFARDVAAMVRVELARRGDERSMWFDSAVLPPVQLLRALLSCPRSGRLMLVGGRAEIRLRGGKLIDARFDGRGSDLDTVVRSLALTDGEYELKLEPINGFAELQCGLREMVELVMPRLQRWARVLERSLPLESQLTVEFSRLAGALKAMPDEVNKIVQLFDGFRSVEQVLVDSPFPETLTLEVATRLYLMGVLAPSKHADHDVLELKPMPRLFEPRPAEAEELMRQLFAGTAEIRADEAQPGSDEDWYALDRTGLEVAEPNGGWTTAPVPEVLADGLSPELARQLDAFQTPMQVEAPSKPVEQQQMSQFAQREHAMAASETAIEIALQQAAERPGAEDPEFDEELSRFRAQSRGRQSRIETPWMTPVVTPDQIAEASEPPAPTVVVEPEPMKVSSVFVAAEPSSPKFAPALDLMSLAAPVAAKDIVARSAAVVTVMTAPIPVVAKMSDEAFDAESSFFASNEASEPMTGETLTPPLRNDRRLWPFVVAGLAIGALGLAIDALTGTPAPVAAPARAEVVAPATVTPPPNLPDIEAPEFYVEEAVPAVDVSENLAEAKKLNEQGQYKRAISVLEQVLTDDPTSITGWTLMGLAKYDSHDVAGAKAAAYKVLELDPKNPRVHLLLATMHLDANEKELGKAELEKYLELDPNGPHADEAKALLKR
jgi:DNA-binding response OmpR family regulator